MHTYFPPPPLRCVGLDNQKVRYVWWFIEGLLSLDLVIFL